MEKMYDLAMLMMLLAIGIVCIGDMTRVYSQPIMAEANDKTAVRSSTGGVSVDVDLGTGSDLLMSLVVVDEFVEHPRAIRINDTPVIRFTDEWIYNKPRRVAQIFSASGEHKLSRMLDYKITSIKYIEDINGDYLQYTLEP